MSKIVSTAVGCLVLWCPVRREALRRDKPATACYCHVRREALRRDKHATACYCHVRREALRSDMPCFYHYR